MNCPNCSNAMVKAKATTFGDEYDYCRTCKKELAEMIQVPVLEETNLLPYDEYINSSWIAGGSAGPAINFNGTPPIGVVGGSSVGHTPTTAIAVDDIVAPNTNVVPGITLGSLYRVVNISGKGVVYLLTNSGYGYWCDESRLDVTRNHQMLPAGSKTCYSVMYTKFHSRVGGAETCDCGQVRG